MGAELITADQQVVMKSRGRTEHLVRVVNNCALLVLAVWQLYIYS